MNTKLIISTFLATLAGEIVLILLTTVAQEVLVNGVYIESSSVDDLILGGIATLIAGIISGIVASSIGGKLNNKPHIFISILIGIETLYLISSGKATNNPLWFDIISGIALIISIWVGY